jgi:iron(III) transport system ATP-binding protein
VPDGAAVRVCIRPHHVHVAGGPTGIRATVLSSEFLGETHRMTLEVAGLDEPLCARTSGGGHLAAGNLVFLDVDPSGVLVVRDDDC